MLRDENRRIYTDLYIRTLGLSITITVLYESARLSDRLLHVDPADALFEPLDDLRPVAVLDLTAGAHHGLESCSCSSRGVINESLIAVGIIGEDGRFSLNVQHVRHHPSR